MLQLQIQVEPNERTKQHPGKRREKEAKEGANYLGKAKALTSVGDGRSESLAQLLE